MSQVIDAPPRYRTVADLLHELGDIPADRVRLRPAPGTATERDVIEIEAREKRLCELIDGVLVEKTVGFDESLVAAALSRHLGNFVEAGNLGLVAGSDGMIRLLPDQVRIPDVGYFSRQSLPKKRSREPIPAIIPDLAVEILSKGNSKGEMDRKLREYFQAGVRLVWLIDPRTRTARVFTSPKEMRRLKEDESLDGGDVLPGFVLPLCRLFDCLE